MLRLQSGGAEEARRIEERRIKLATSLGALYQLVIQPSSSAQSANALADKILTASQLKLSLADQLAILSAVVHERQHLVQAGASAEDAVTDLVAENLLHDAGRVPGGPAPGADGGHALPSRLIEKALMLPKFQEALKLRHHVWRHSNSAIVSGGTIVTLRSGGGYTARQRVDHIGSSRHRTADARGTAQRQATEGSSRHRAADA